MAESPQGSTPAGAGMPLIYRHPDGCVTQGGAALQGTNKADYELLLINELERMRLCSRFCQLALYPQHGKINVYQHCVAVAYMSCRIAGALHLKVDYTSLIRGALLHDYFLYDWHVPNAEHRLHGLRHPRRALQNAREDFALTPLEADIILRHMFPLTLVPPACPEGWAVCMADKLCALLETLRPAGWERKWPYGGAPRPPAA